jgi:tetratricopeptide (TPR) repeat protein
MDENELPKTRNELEQAIRDCTAEVASTEDGYAALARLWFYCYLRASRTELANTCPIEVFQLLLHEAYDEASHLLSFATDKKQLAWFYLLAARYFLTRPNRRKDALAFLGYAQTTAGQPDGYLDRCKLLCEIGLTLVQTEQEEQAHALWLQVAKKAASSHEQCCVLASTFLQAGMQEESVKMWERAEQSARAIGKNQYYNTLGQELLALCEVAQRLADSEQHAAALKLCRELEGRVQRENIKNSEKAEVLCTLLELYTALQQAERRQYVVALIEEMVPHVDHTCGCRTSALQTLSWALSLAGQPTRAEEVLSLAVQWDEEHEEEDRYEGGYDVEEADAPYDELDDEQKSAWLHAQMLSQRFREHLRLQQWDECEEATGRMESSYERLNAYRDLLKALVHAQEWQRALALWHRVKWDLMEQENYAHPANSLIELAKPLLAAGRWEQAQPLLLKALDYAGQTHSRDDRMAILRTLAEIFAQRQAWSEAERVIAIFQELEDDGLFVDKDMPVPWQAHCAPVLIIFGAALAQANQQERAESLFELALQYSSAIEGWHEGWHSAWFEIAEGFVRVGQMERARTLAQQQLYPDDLAQLLIIHGTILCQDGQREQAETAWVEAEQCVAESTIDDKAFVMLKLGDTLVQAGEMERAGRVFQDIEAYIRETCQGYEWRRAEFMLDLVRGWLQLRQRDRALPLIADLRQLCVRNNLRTAHLIEGMLAVLALHYQLPDAERLWRNLQRLAEREARQWEPYLFQLFDVAEELVRTDRHEEARTLLSLLQKAAEAHPAPGLRDSDLCKLGTLVVETGDWAWAQAIANAVKDVETYAFERMPFLLKLAQAMGQHGDYEQLASFLQRLWPTASSRGANLQMLGLATGLVSQQPELAAKLYNTLIAVLDHPQTE